jgi:DNA-binding response OmpR family regulator
MAQTILVVDDEAVLVETITYNLEQAGYHVVAAADGAGALAVIAQTRPDLILLDVMLPEMDGLELCRAIRREQATATTPILMLTAKGEEIDKVVGLEVGADDYVTKPFGRHELFARIRTLLRRAEYPTMQQARLAQERLQSQTPPRELVVGPLSIDLAGRRVTCRGILIELQPKQFDLLVHLARNRGTVLTRGTLLTHVWGYDYTGDTRTVDVHVRWLREKIESDPSDPQLIQTVRGIGYVLRWS